MESKRKGGRPPGSKNKKTLQKEALNQYKTGIPVTPVTDPEEEFKTWVLNNRIKFINPKQFTHQEKLYVIKNYNRKYNTNKKVGCGNCFYEVISEIKKLYFKDL